MDERIHVMTVFPLDRLTCEDAGEASMLAAVFRDMGIPATALLDTSGERPLWTFDFEPMREFRVKEYCALTFIELCKRTTNDRIFVSRDGKEWIVS